MNPRATPLFRGLKRAVECLFNGLFWIAVGVAVGTGILMSGTALFDLVEASLHITTGAIQ